jgi:hypothetical protein
VIIENRLWCLAPEDTKRSLLVEPSRQTKNNDDDVEERALVYSGLNRWIDKSLVRK